MSEQPDPERLLAEALRAKAVRAPMPDLSASTRLPSMEPGTPDSLLRLFAGSEPQYDMLPWQMSEHTDVEPQAPANSTYTVRLQGPRPLSVWWIVLLAVLLGLAAGAVVALVTVL